MTHNHMMWKKYINSSIAGLFTIGQTIFIFFYSVNGISALRIFGFIIWIISIIFGFLPMFFLKKSGDVQKGKSYIHTKKLVDRGLYGIVRHPQYLALPLFNIALMLISQHGLIIIFGIPAIFFMALDLRNADEEGLEKFGEAYREYMKKVPKINIIAGIVRIFRK